MKRNTGESEGIPYIEYSNSLTNPPLLFLHANAFPSDCYLPLFEKISQKYTIVSPLFRPLWEIPGDEKKLRNWTPLLNDMVKFIVSKFPNKSLNILGHSLGGNIGLRLCLEFPEFVNSAVLMDPILFSRKMIFLWQFIQWTSIGYKLHPMIKASKNQRLNYRSNQEMFNRYRKKTVFKNISDINLKFLINGLTKTNPGGDVELTFPKKWELQVYQSGMSADREIWKRLKLLKKKVLILKAEYTHAPSDEVVQSIEKISSFVELKYLSSFSHFFPFEIPEQIADIVKSFLKIEKA